MADVFYVLSGSLFKGIRLSGLAIEKRVRLHF